MTATEASRNFSALLDAVERGERVGISRGGRVIAEVSPGKGGTLRGLLAATAALPPAFDEEFVRRLRELHDSAGPDDVENPWGSD